jgi:quinoprotein glucose dehydrogenase
MSNRLGRHGAFAKVAAAAGVIALASLAVHTARLSAADTPAKPSGNWMDYGAAEDSSQYSPLKQIDKSNVKDLELVWFYPSPNAAGRFGYNPVIVDGVMYVMGKSNSIVALNAATGKEVWVHPNDSGITNRGINYWESADRSDRRLIFAANSYLQEINAKTGVTIPSFGNDGKVDMREGLGRDPKSVARIQSGTPGRIYGNLIIVGSSTGEEYGSPPGDIRAYDILTGKQVWIFHTVPHPGEFGYDTWPPEAWKYIGGVNNWGEMTIDEKRGILYIPTGSPTYDFYGADRVGADLFSDCLVALDAKTGKRLWHFQFVHHDLWDYDAVMAPKLVTVKHDGKMVDAVAQATKQGFLYAFDRVSGQPLWPVEERAVPKSDMPGEHSWPTQPFPSKPPAFARQSFTVADVNPYISDPKELERVKQWVGEARFEGLFTPPGMRNTIQIPGNNGGGNWGGGATDPTTGFVYIMSKDAPTVLKLEAQRPRNPFNASPAAQGRALYETNCISCHGIDRNGHAGVAPSIVDAPQRLGADAVAAIIKNGRGEMPGFGQLTAQNAGNIVAYLTNPAAADQPPQGGGRGRGQVPQEVAGPVTPGTKYWTGYGTMDATDGMPAIGPPWSTITAYDLNEGTIKWQIPLGIVPSLAAKGIRNTGSYWPRGGPVVTAGGLIFAPSGSDLTAHAYDKDTGKILWEKQLKSGPEGIPAVYEVNGREYVVFCARSGRVSDNLPANPSQVVQTIGEPDAQGFYVFALPERAALRK